MEELETQKVFGPTNGKQIVGAYGEIHQSVTSTMDIARRKAQDAPDGYTVLAEQQTEGRGRDGTWICSPGQGLLLTVILHATIPPADRCLLSLLGPLAAAGACREVGIDAQIKWPNDIVIVRRSSPLSLKKLGGTLVEQSPGQKSSPSHLLGLGLNVNQQPDDLSEISGGEPTSLRIERGGARIRRAQLCRNLLEKLDRWYQTLCSGDYASMKRRWKDLNCLGGKWIRVQSRKRELSGRVTKICASGELTLKTPSGETHRLRPQTTTVLGTGTDARH